MPTITAHCLVKNEENFVGYAIRSVIDFVDQIIVFDTGSTDNTVPIVQKLIREYPNKIILEEKGECDKVRHTQLRQEILDRTTTDWFMILDGDEVWTNRAMLEAVAHIKSGRVAYIESYFYECVGDIFHTHFKPGYKTIRFVRTSEVMWKGDYGVDSFILKQSGAPLLASSGIVLHNKFWHLTHLVRSRLDGGEFSSGSSRSRKRRLTYAIIGRRIKERLPEVFDGIFLKSNTLGPDASLINFFGLLFNKIFQ